MNRLGSTVFNAQCDGDRIEINDLCVFLFFHMSNAMDNKFSIELKIRKKELFVTNKLIYGTLSPWSPRRSNQMIFRIPNDKINENRQKNSIKSKKINDALTDR